MNTIGDVKLADYSLFPRFTWNVTTARIHPELVYTQRLKTLEVVMKKLLLALVLLFCSSQAGAAIIDHGSYLSDTETGYDWLDVSTTNHMSVNFVESQFGSGGLFEGWRYAYMDELEVLFDHMGGTRHPDGFYGGEIENTATVLMAMALLGSTGISGNNIIQFGMVANERDFGNGTIARWNTQLHLRNTLDYGSIDTSGGYDTSIDYASSYIGSYLVRSSVPEPETLALLAFGLLGFAFTRKNRGNTIEAV